MKVQVLLRMTQLYKPQVGYKQATKDCFLCYTYPFHFFWPNFIHVMFQIKGKRTQYHNDD